MIRNKTIKFNMDKEDDRKLWSLLQSLPHGLFSEATKHFWENAFKVAEEENKPENVWRKQMHEQLTRIQIPWLAELDKPKEEQK